MHEWPVPRVSSKLGHALSSLPDAPPDLVYRLESPAQGEHLLDLLASDQPTRPDGSGHLRQTAYDTFDWRLFHAGVQLTVVRSGGRQPQLVWRSHKDDEAHRQPWTGDLGFAWDLPEGPLRERLAPLIAMRRLSPIVELHQQWRQVAVLDGQDRPAARLVLERLSARLPGKRTGPALPTQLRLRAVPGHPEAQQALRQKLTQDRNLRHSRAVGLATAMDAIGRQPGDYKDKIDVTLDPAERADEATRQILRALLAIIEVNHPGTLADLDSEHLHDFRVSVRRTRSALSQVKGVFPSSLAQFQREFKWLGTRTGPTRDLDVYLLKLPAYGVSLPESVRPDLEPLARFLIARQKVEQRRMARSLTSQRYHRLIEQWTAFLDAASPDPAPPNAALPVLDVARQRIWRMFRKVYRAGSAIDDSSPAEMLHAMRIDCKKLRYLLELFRSLYPATRIRRLIRALKQLQDNLGDFNDYEVQQIQLTSHAHRMADSGNIPVQTQLAMGRLLAHLNAGQQGERQAFAARFARFAAVDNKREFRKLFKE